MLLAVSFLLFGACVVSSNPVKKSYSIQKPTDLESQYHVELHADFLIRNERGSRKCTHGGKTYLKGTTLGIPVKQKDNGYRCDRCKCIKGHFRNCKTIHSCDIKCDEYEFPPYQCCPVCKPKSCGEDGKVGDEWYRIEYYTGPNEGNCSKCYLAADCKERCSFFGIFKCFDRPGCLETEMTPNDCCPQCKKWASTTSTTQPPFSIQLTETEPTEPFTFPPGFKEDKES